MKNSGLLAVNRALGELSGKDMPIPTALSITRRLRQLSQPLEDYNKVYEGLVDKHAERGEDGEKTGKWADIEAFKADLEELLELEVELELEPIKASTLGDIHVTPAALFTLEEHGVLDDDGNPTPNREERRRKKKKAD